MIRKFVYFGSNVLRFSSEPGVIARDVTTGVFDTTMVAPKFSDTLTISQPGRTDVLMVKSKFTRGYIPDSDK